MVVSETGIVDPILVIKVVVPIVDGTELSIVDIAVLAEGVCLVLSVVNVAMLAGLSVVATVVLSAVSADALAVVTVVVVSGIDIGPLVISFVVPIVTCVLAAVSVGNAVVISV